MLLRHGLHAPNQNRVNCFPKRCEGRDEIEINTVEGGLHLDFHNSLDQK